MTRFLRKFATLVLGTAVFAVSFGWDGRLSSIADATFVTPAHAVVGRPLTPVSYAGVARRTTRRAVVATSVARPVAAPTTVVVAAPTTQTCVDTVNANGSITRTCR